MKFFATSFLLFGFVSGAQALSYTSYGTGTAIPTAIASFDMTDFAVTAAGGTTQSIASPISGSLGFYDRYDNLTDMTIGLADSTAWWVNSELQDYNIFTTSLHLITIKLPEYTRAFAFNVGANVNAGAWFTATDSNGSMIKKSSIALGPTKTPGFGIYADNTVGSCSYITEVTIDPSLIWGFGNFSINQDSCSTSVPEASSVYLFFFGLLGLVGLAVRRV